MEKVKVKRKREAGQPRLTFLGSLVAGVLGIVALVYLIAPTFGLIEFIPDAIPVVGNLDEVTATMILLACLGYFGISIPWLTPFLKRRYGVGEGKQSEGETSSQGEREGKEESL